MCLEKMSYVRRCQLPHKSHSGTVWRQDPLCWEAVLVGNRLVREVEDPNVPR